MIKNIPLFGHLPLKSGIYLKNTKKYFRHREENIFYCQFYPFHYMYTTVTKFSADSSRQQVDKKKYQFSDAYLVHMRKQ